MKSRPVIVVGSLNMDLVVRAPWLPKAGETILGGEFQTFPGGKGANQAVAVARMGANVIMLGKVGRDAFGDSLIHALEADGVDTKRIAREPQTATGVAQITVSEIDGQNTIVVAPGANAQLAPTDIRCEEGVFEGAGMLVIQLETPLPTVTQAARLARQHGLTVVLNPAPAQSLPDELLAVVDYLVPNQTELSLLAGGIEDLETAIQKVLSKLPGKLIVTLGSKGALVASDQQRLEVPPFKVTPVDTVAAGDAFIGALATALNEGQALEQAVLWGNAAGALATTRAGAQPSLPRREEVLAMIKTGPAV